MEESTGSEKKVLKIEQVEKLNPSQQVITNVVDGIGEITPSKTKFDAALVKADNNWEDMRSKGTSVATLEAPTKPSPIDEMSSSVRKIQRLEPASTEKVLNQAQEIKTNLVAPIEKLDETIKTNPNIKLSPAYEVPLSEKLVHIDSSLKSALGIAGVEVKGAPAPTGSAHPLEKFLNYLTHGDKQLSSLVSEIQIMSGPEAKSMTPGKLLAVQVKLSFVQQELEFFTNVLNKALESTKTIMNVQV
jgi:hypothetical protein